MGKILEQMKTKDLNEKFCDSLIWYVNSMNKLIDNSIKDMNSINEALKATLKELKEESK